MVHQTLFSLLAEHITNLHLPPPLKLGVTMCLSSSTLNITEDWLRWCMSLLGPALRSFSCPPPSLPVLFGSAGIETYWRRIEDVGPTMSAWRKLMLQDFPVHSSVAYSRASLPSLAELAGIRLAAWPALTNTRNERWAPRDPSCRRVREIHVLHMPRVPVLFCLLSSVGKPAPPNEQAVHNELLHHRHSGWFKVSHLP